MAIVVIIIGQTIARFMVPEGREDDLVLKIIVTLVYGVFVFGGLLLLFQLIYKRNPRQLGLIMERWFSSLLYGLGIGAVSCLLILVGFILACQSHISARSLDTLTSVGLMIEFASLFVFAFSEELFARGYIMTAFKTTRNKYMILLSSAVIFGLIHLLNPGATILSIVNMSLGGLLLAYMFAKSGKLWLPIGYHIAINFMSGDILGLPSSSGVSVSQSVFTTSIGNNDFLSGGSNGHESGFLLTIVVLLGLLYVHFLVKTPSGDQWTMDNHLPFANHDGTS
jgi:membrane protease YdiL (CAAX protease family)